MIRKNTQTILFITVFFAFCGGNGKKSQQNGMSLTITCEPVEIKVSESVNCKCFETDGGEIDGEFIVEPEDNSKVEGNSIIFNVQGNYDVKCRAQGKTSESGAGIKVFSAETGKIKKTVTTLDPLEIEAGSESKVQCTAYDESDNEIEGLKFSVSVPDNVNYLEEKVTSTKSGQYEIMCIPAQEGLKNSENQPAVLVVNPKNPPQVKMKAMPVSDLYKVGEEIEISASIEDEYGNMFEKLTMSSIEVSPSGKVKKIEESGAKSDFKLLDEGMITFSAHAEEDQSVKGELPVKVEGAGPKITVISPERGASLEDIDKVEVSGIITDASGIASVSLNGKPLALGMDGSFKTEMKPQHGVNLIVIEAEDTKAHKSRHVQSFHYTLWYYPNNIPEKLDDALVQNGVYLYLDDESFNGKDPQKVTSLQEIMNEYLKTVDLKAMIPNPVANQKILWCNYSITLSNIKYGIPDIIIYPEDGSLYFDLYIPDFSADVSAPSPEFACPDVTGKISAEGIWITADALIGLDENNNVKAELKNIDVQLINLQVDLYGIAGELLQAFISLFKEDFDTMIEEQFGAEIKKKFEEQITAILGYINIDLPAKLHPLFPGGSSPEVVIHLRPSKITIGKWGVTYGMGATVTAQKKTDKESPGSIGRAGCLSGTQDTISVDADDILEIAVFEDVINAMLHASWWNGAFDVKMDQEMIKKMGQDPAQYGISDLLIITSALLPPVFEQCRDDKLPRLELSDLQVDTTFKMAGMDVEIKLYIFFSSLITIDFDGEEGKQAIFFHYDNLDWMDMQLYSVNDEWIGNEQVFEDMIKNMLLPKIIDVMKSAPYHFPVPVIPMTDISKDFPAGKKLIPVIKEIKQQEGSILVKGTVKVK
jgi:hypothetical protein